MRSDYIRKLNKCIFQNLKKKRLEKVDMQTPHESSWTPLLWAMKLLARAKSDQKITIEPPSYANLQSSFEKVENVNRKLLRYSWINFPLAYTQVRYIQIIDESQNQQNIVCYIINYIDIIIPFIQVANLAVLTYFVAALFSRQYFIPDSNDPRFDLVFPNSTVTFSKEAPFNKHSPDLIFPFFTIIELICYMGWIQVATSLLNPFGGKCR